MKKGCFIIPKQFHATCRKGGEYNPTPLSSNPRGAPASRHQHHLFKLEKADDGKDVLVNEEDLPSLKEHFEQLHTNLSWENKSGKEGSYLDLWVMIVDGKIDILLLSQQ